MGWRGGHVPSSVIALDRIKFKEDSRPRERFSSGRFPGCGTVMVAVTSHLRADLSAWKSRNALQQCGIGDVENATHIDRTKINRITESRGECGRSTKRIPLEFDEHIAASSARLF